MAKIKIRAVEWCCILVVIVLTALPLYGLISSVGWAIFAHAGAVVLYLLCLIVFGEGSAVEFTIPIIIMAVLCGMLWQAKQKHDQREQRQKRTLPAPQQPAVAR